MTPDASPWQPIDTAPHNRIVLVYMAGTAGLGIYCAICADWNLGEEPQIYWRPTGYTLLDDFPRGAEITHWMPLPEPPASDVDGGSTDHPRLTTPATPKGPRE